MEACRPGGEGQVCVMRRAHQGPREQVWDFGERAEAWRRSEDASRGVGARGTLGLAWRRQVGACWRFESGPLCQRSSVTIAASCPALALPAV